MEKISKGDIICFIDNGVLYRVLRAHLALGADREHCIIICETRNKKHRRISLPYSEFIKRYEIK